MTAAHRSADNEGRNRILAIADSLAQGAEAAAQETEKPAGWISFAIGDRSFALPVSHIRAVHRAGHITPLPRSPRAVRGLTNLRGRVMAVLDLATQLGLGATEISADGRILETEIGRRRLGLLAERTESLIKVRSTDIEPLDEETAPAVARRASGLVATKTGQVVLLDPEQILEEVDDPPPNGG